MTITLHHLLSCLLGELSKDSDKGRIEHLVSQCVQKAMIIANHARNKKLKNDYLKAVRSVSQQSRKRNPAYDDINLWGRIVYNTLSNTFPYRY